MVRIRTLADWMDFPPRPVSENDFVGLARFDERGTAALGVLALAEEIGFRPDAEGATAPETLRQTDRRA